MTRFRCPCCGALAWPSTLDRNFSLDVYTQKSLGKAHGFRYEKVENPSLVAHVKAKIATLSASYSENQTDDEKL